MASKITTSRSPGGRLLTIEWLDALASTSAYIEEIARHGGNDGYVVVAEDAPSPETQSKKKPQSSTLHISILLRPALTPSRGTMIPVLGAIALTRSIRRHSTHEPMIRWISDIYVGKQQIASASIHSSLRPSGSFRYVIVNFSLSITQSFAGSLSDVVRSVFSVHRETLSQRVAETLINEFFTLYEGYATTDSVAFLDEYRELSLLRGKWIRFLRNGRRVPATVIGIDDSARLVVTPRHGESVVLHSVAELYDPRRMRRQRKDENA